MFPNIYFVTFSFSWLNSQCRPLTEMQAHSAPKMPALNRRCVSLRLGAHTVICLQTSARLKLVISQQADILDACWARCDQLINRFFSELVKWGAVWKVRKLTIIQLCPCFAASSPTATLVYILMVCVCVCFGFLLTNGNSFHHFLQINSGSCINRSKRSGGGAQLVAPRKPNRKCGHWVAISALCRQGC